MKKIFCFASAILILTGVFAAPGGEFWDKKPYKEWSQKECERLLTKSPWSQEFTPTIVGIMDNSQNKVSSDGQQPYVKYQVQFNSAKPIRQATVRQAQIAQNYDGLPPEQRQEADKRAAAFLSADLSNAVIVNVTYSTNNRVWDMELARYWQSQTTDLLKNSIYISNTKGDKIYIARFAAAQGAQRNMQFIFPREVDGKPILGSQDKSFKLEFAYPANGDPSRPDIPEGKAFLEFKVDKMIFEGNIAY